MKLWGRKFSEAWTACMLCMVQGDLTVISLNHALTASKTGTLAGIAYVLASQTKFTGRWLGAYLTGVLTMLADIIAHPTHFGPHWAEAAVTGLVAAVICMVWDEVRS